MKKSKPQKRRIQNHQNNLLILIRKFLNICKLVESKEKSFTLLELLIVIAVIAILAAIVMVSLSGARQSAQEARGLQFSQNIKSTLATDLVGEWTFDDQNNLAKDDSGNGNDGVIVGNVSYINSGRVRGAVDFNVGRIEINKITNIPGDMTISGWFKKTTSSWGSIAFLGKRNSNTGWMLYRNSGDVVGYFRWYSHYINTSGTILEYPPWSSGIYDLTVGNWYYITITRTATGNTKIYLNGKLTSEYSPPTDFSSWSLNSYGISIGSERAGSANWSCVGAQIDEVRIYSRALTAYEIKALYAQGKMKHLADR